MRSERDEFKLCDGCRAPRKFPGVGCLQDGLLDLVIAFVIITIARGESVLICVICDGKR